MTEIEIVRDDITRVEADAVVNAANTRMRGGGGVDGAIHRAGGPAVLEDCIRRFPDGLAIGDAGYTTAGDLLARWVIHTVGPDFTRRQRNRGLLESCYRRSLAVADDLGAGSVAFPLISAGAYGWPIDDAIAAAIDTIGATDTQVKTVRIVTLDEALHRAMVEYREFTVPFRILEGVGDLHRRGYESVRVLPYLSPSGMHWRLDIGAAGDGPSGLERSDGARKVRYSSSSREECAHGIVTGATPVRAIGDLILAELDPETLRAADPAYATWFRDLLNVCRESRELPWAFDDDGDREGGWFGDDRVPSPPNRPS